MASYNPQQVFNYTGGATGTNVPQVNLPNPSDNLGAQIPGLSEMNNQLSSLISSELAGNISPSLQSQLQNMAATYGTGTGMPGSGLQSNDLLKSLGLTSESEQQKGVSNYNSTIPTISSTQTLSPALEWEANLQNAVSSASPNPEEAVNQLLSELQGPASGTTRSSLGNSPFGAVPGAITGGNYNGAGAGPGGILQSMGFNVGASGGSDPSVSVPVTNPENAQGGYTPDLGNPDNPNYDPNANFDWSSLLNSSPASGGS